MDGRSRRCRSCQNANPYERTPEHKGLQRELHLGKRHNYRSGGSLPGVAQKIAAAWTPEMRDAARQRGLEMVANPKDRLRFGRPGMLNANYLNGQSVVPYESGWTRKLKSQVLDRDHHQCQDCGKRPTRPLHIHHKDFAKRKHALSNLIALCHQCHFARHAEHRQSVVGRLDSRKMDDST